jgi:hypothetical protein
MFNAIALLFLASGIYLSTFWARENLRKKALLCFSIIMIIIGLLIFLSINIYNNVAPGIGNSLSPIDENEVIKMRELLSIY